MTLVLVRSASPHRNGPKEYFSLQVSFYCVDSKYILLIGNRPYKSGRSGNCSCDLFSQPHSLSDLGQRAEIFPNLCIVMSLNCFNNSTRFLSINNSMRKRRKICHRDPGEFGGRTMLQNLILHIWGRGWPAHVCRLPPGLHLCAINTFTLQTKFGVWPPLHTQHYRSPGLFSHGGNKSQFLLQLSVYWRQRNPWSLCRLIVLDSHPLYSISH